MPSMFKSLLSNNSIKDIFPVDSPLSYKLIGRITILFILPAPECMILLSSTIVEPVKTYNPSSSDSSTKYLTVSHNSGAICHSSISIGFSPFNNSMGLVSASIK